MRTAKMSSSLAASLFMMVAPPAHAQGYPAKEITAVCPFAAGTGADITVRYFLSLIHISEPTRPY